MTRMNIDTLMPPPSVPSSVLLAGCWSVCFMHRRQTERQSRNAARAVYFELSMNAIDIKVAAEHLVFQPLRRGSFDCQLPELAHLAACRRARDDRQGVHGHAGYDQAQRDDKLPAPVRKAVLHKVLEQHARPQTCCCDVLLCRGCRPTVDSRYHRLAPAETSTVAAGARNA